MKTQALICDADQKFTLEEFEVPELADSEVLIRTLYSGVSVGTEFAVIQGKLDWGPYPLCTGYQAVGIIEEAGSAVKGYEVGDKVYYRRNYMPMALGGKKINNAAGTHSSLAIIEPASAEGIAHLPPAVDEATASMFVMPAVGYNAVNMAGIQMGDIVIVHGTGLIGLGAIAAAGLRGAVTIGIDINADKLELAAQLGADYVINSAQEDLAARVAEIAPDGPDVVLEGTGIPACLDTALALCRTHGKFVFLGNYGNAPISFHFLIPHVKQLTAFFPCNDGLAPSRQAVLKLIGSGALPWEKTISHRIGAEESPALYDAINKGQAGDVMGAVIDWS